MSDHLHLIFNFNPQCCFLSIIYFMHVHCYHYRAIFSSHYSPFSACEPAQKCVCVHALQLQLKPKFMSNVSHTHQPVCAKWQTCWRYLATQDFKIAHACYELLRTIYVLKKCRINCSSLYTFCHSVIPSSMECANLVPGYIACMHSSHPDTCCTRIRGLPIRQFRRKK